MDLYDVIVVGAGSAGSVLAARLSEERSCRVLLLEAGGRDRRPEIHVPAAFSWLFKSSCDWAFETDPEPNLAGRRLYWPRGKVLGGSSSINAMIWIRGHRQDYDHWAQLGNPGWSFDDVLPFFKRAEAQLPINHLISPNPFSHIFIQACTEVGIQTNSDFNGEVQEGAGFYRVTQRGGWRASAAVAYLRPALTRSNLRLHTHAQACHLVCEAGRAVGVAYLHQGRSVQARCKEIVLCGGAINSPQLLLLSGVGPAHHLEEMGIPVVVDLPGVGGNLQDHLISGVTCACSDRRTLDNVPGLIDVIHFLFRRRGRLTSNVAEAGAFVRMTPEKTIPDVQFHFAPVYYVQHGFVRPKGAGYSIGATVLRPKSRGQIRLRSRDPLAPPSIQPNYLSDPDDRSTQLAGLKLARRIAHASAFSKVRIGEQLPGAEVCEDEGLERYLRQQSETLYHPVGTCKMGRDALAVVDAELRVHGIQGLRVVDASIMPTLVGGNTNAATIVIAEKASDFILGRSPQEEKPS
jgi:choline dehydrogenase